MRKWRRAEVKSNVCEGARRWRWRPRSAAAAKSAPPPRRLRSRLRVHVAFACARRAIRLAAASLRFLISALSEYAFVCLRPPVRGVAASALGLTVAIFFSRSKISHSFCLATSGTRTKNPVRSGRRRLTRDVRRVVVRFVNGRDRAQQAQRVLLRRVSDCVGQKLFHPAWRESKIVLRVYVRCLVARFHIRSCNLGGESLQKLYHCSSPSLMAKIRDAKKEPA